MQTNKSLLIRAKQDQKGDAWFKLVGIYEPLIAGWLRRCEIRDSDVSDLTQEVLLTIAKRLPRFQHNGRIGAFRNWVRKIALNRVRRHWENHKRRLPTSTSFDSSNLLNRLVDPNDQLSRQWDIEHDHYVLEKILQFVSLEFDKPTMIAFRRLAIDEIPAKVIAKELNVSIGQVYKFKYRVMKRLVEEAQGLIDVYGNAANPCNSPNSISNMMTLIKRIA